MGFSVILRISRITEGFILAARRASSQGEAAIAVVFMGLFFLVYELFFWLC